MNMGISKSRVCTAAALAVLSLASFAFGAAAQERAISVDGRGGVAIPTGRLDDVTDPGPFAGLKLNFPVADRLAVTLDGEFGDLDGATLGAVRAPDLRLWSYGVGLQASLLPERTTIRRRWAVLGDVGLGAMTYDSKEFRTSPTDGMRTFKHTYFQTNAGVVVEYDATSRFHVFAGAQGSLSFADKNETSVLAALDPSGGAKAFGANVTIPISAGFTIHM